MFKTKRDVDRHVSHILNRIRDEKERNSRGYQFAKLYYDVAEYESGKRYLQAFLSVRETVPQAHKLMGQIYEAQKDKNKALESYKRSLDLEPEQKDVILKVCELYSDISVKVSSDVAKIWIERAEKFYPNDHTVFKLKEKVIGIDGGGDDEELEHLISEELVKNPGDVKLHIKLLRLFIQSREVERAYEHAITTEKTLAFVSSMDWYECLADVYQVYQDQHGGGDEMTLYVHKLVAMATLTFLRLQADDRNVIGAVKALHNLDEDLFVASSLRRHSTEWDCFLTEMKGQLFYLMGLLLLKRALKGQVSWKEASSLSAICFLLSDSFQPLDLKSSWFCQAKPDWKKFYERLYMSGCDRLSQGGHMVYAVLSKQDGGQLSKKLRQKLCTPQGKTSLYGLVFTGVEVAKKKDTSYFLHSDVFTSTQLDTPSRKQLLQYDGVGYALHGGDLNHIVWLALHHYSLKDEVQPDYEQLFGHQLYPEMKYSVLDLSSGDPGSMCQLDVQVFLYTCVRWAALQSRDRKRNLHTIADKPDFMPACLSSPSCTKQQCDWWTAVNNMEKKTSREKISKLWGTVMRGLETIRLVTPNVMSLPLVVHIAKTLDARAHEIRSLDAEGIVTPKLSGMRGRAAFYWTTASEMIDRIDRNISIKTPKELLFPCDSVINPALVKEIREQVKFAMAIDSMNKENYKEALSAFENLYNPEASFYSGQIYRKLAKEQDQNTNSSAGGDQQNSQEMIMLSKSKTSLYQALDRLETDQNEELKDKVRRELDDVVCKMISLESDGGLVDSILSYNSLQYDTAGSDVDSDEEPFKVPSSRNPTLPPLSQSHERSFGSPTKVEVQLRALEMVNTALSSRLSTLEDTVKNNANYVQEILKQMEKLREENKTLRDQMQILSLQGLSSMSMVRAQGTPQQPARINPMNMSFGAAPMYDFQGQNGLPAHMAQYGYSTASPRPGSAYGPPTYDDGFSHVDGEFYDPDNESEFFNADQNLIQEWPFGHKTGVEGKSTITYSPQPQVRCVNPASAGMFASALRGQSIQYGAGYPALVPQQAPSQLPGPGYFSQNSSLIQQAALQTQAGMIQAQYGMATKQGTVPAMSPSMQPAMSPAMQPKPAPAPSTASKPATPMMPPNAVIASQTLEAKPTLIPGSVGIPAVTTSVTVSTKASIPSGVSIQGQVQPGPASSILSSLAAKHQDGSSLGATNVSTPQKTVFKGFSFTSTPKITEPKAEDKGKEENPQITTAAAAATKPFSGFSLTPSKSTVASSKTPASDVTQSTAESQGTGSGFTFGQSKSSSFGNLAAQGQTATAFQASGDKGFSGAGAPVFGKTPPRRHNISTGSDDHTEEYEPNVDFKPVIQLPELVEIKTGEEEEEKMFCERAKLFRFDKDAEQWKERGIGDMKILQHRETKSVRILMRREQVLKLCANHKLTVDMKLTPLTSSDRSWVWNAMDFAEGEMKHEKFAVKFKSVDTADKFKVVFEKCQTELSLALNEPAEDVKKESKIDEGKDNEEKPGLASLFRPKVGSWTCDGCYVNNNSEVIKCPCCGSLKPGAKPEDVKQEPASSGFGFSFGSKPSDQSSGGFKFNTQPSDASSTAKTESGFKFGSGAQQADSKPTPSSGFTFVTPTTSQQTTGFVFGSPAATSSQPFGTKPTTTSTTTSGGFKFGEGSTSQPSSSSIFEKSDTTSSSSLFGVKTDTATTSGSIFGGKPDSTTQGSSLFGMKPDTTTNGSIFQVKPDSPNTNNSLFGVKLDASTTSGSISEGKPGTITPSVSTFGGKPDSTTPSGSTFVGKPDSTTPSGSTFGGKPDSTTPSSSIFGGKPDSTTPSGSMFGGKPDSTTPSSSIFGGKPESTTPSSSMFGGKTNTPTASGTVFGVMSGMGASSSTFGGAPSFSSLFGSAQTGKDFGSGVAQTVPEDKGVAEIKEQKSNGESLLAKFLTSPDSWNCDGCYVNNEGVVEKCPCCGTARPEDKAPSSTASSIATARPNVMSGNTGAGFNFGKSTAELESKTDAESKTAFAFGVPATETGQKAESFQFGTSPKTSTEGFKFSFASASDDSKAQPAAAIGSGFNFSLSMTPVKKESSPKSPGSLSKAACVLSPKSPEITEEGFYVNKEGDDSHIHFEPVIDLPDHVEVKTGEENEKVIFSHRAKLFRFVTGEWKERGVGDMKILYQEELRKARIVMRREQILKLCCNHYIVPELYLQTMPSSNGRALVWYAMDFADGEPKTEQFSVKFRSEEIAKNFESAVEEAKGRISGKTVSKGEQKKDASSKSVKQTPTVESIGAVSGVTETYSKDDGDDDDDAVVCTGVEEATDEEIKRARELMLPEHFYLYTRKPACPGCRGCNDEVPDYELASGDAGENNNVSQVHEEDDYDDEDDDDYEDDDEDDDYEDEETEQYGTGGKDEGTESAETRGFVFGGGGNQFSFASLAAGGGGNSFNVDASTPFQWQGAGRQLFGGAKGGADKSGEGGSGDEGDVQQGDEQHFEPVVPLPDLIDVKTGEEDEIVEFSHRAKLFRFDKDTNQWKEKGIGEMKILKHRANGKYRFLLRREQVHKLACNHLLTPDVKVTPMLTSETAWCWTAQDYSEGEMKVEQLAVKFKNIDLSKSFKQKVDEVQVLLLQEQQEES